MPDVFFNGPVGRLEGRFNHGPDKNSPIALILHPHPKHGGTMNNKVVHALYRTFAEQGFSVLRFNFRGVGRSEGVYDNGEGELSDAASALDWLQSTFPQVSKFWVGGFSFGAWIAMQLLMRRPELEGFISISPPANNYDFNFLAPCPVSGKIVQGDNDSVVTHQSVETLVNKLRNQRGIDIGYHLIPEADHFFTNHLDIMSTSVKEYLEERLGVRKTSLAG
jgi:alpha/beta superfamily hydrolase